jgi:hypothetical protein
MNGERAAWLVAAPWEMGERQQHLTPGPSPPTGRGEKGDGNCNGVTPET